MPKQLPRQWIGIDTLHGSFRTESQGVHICDAFCSPGRHSMLMYPPADVTEAELRREFIGLLGSILCSSGRWRPARCTELFLASEALPYEAWYYQSYGELPLHEKNIERCAWVILWEEFSSWEEDSFCLPNNLES
jgi:hypothetical protein